jgi:hypothetical protein
MVILCPHPHTADSAVMQILHHLLYLSDNNCWRQIQQAITTQSKAMPLMAMLTWRLLSPLLPQYLGKSVSSPMKKSAVPRPHPISTTSSTRLIMAATQTVTRQTSQHTMKLRHEVTTASSLPGQVTL